MREVLSDIERWISEGKEVAIAKVISTWGSSPRGVGANLAISSAREMSGSVSGGCVEGAVVEVGLDVLRSKKPRLLQFGVGDETAMGIGLACGGQIEVFISQLDVDLFTTLHKELSAERQVVQAIVIRGPQEMLGKTIILRQDGGVSGTIPTEFVALVIRLAHEAFESGRHLRKVVKSPSPEEVAIEVFVEVIPPRPRLIIVGGVHVSIALVNLARTLGFYTIVVDPRRAFGSPERFLQADELLQVWPEEALKDMPLTTSTAVVMLTHDPKIDDPALKVVLNSPAFYVGALGSRKTHRERCQRLVRAGLNLEQLERIHSPIGLDIGAQKPEEIALAIMGEIVAAQNR
ncbi:MAG: XdhC/CoxI family protein [Chloroflexota bacterium]